MSDVHDAVRSALASFNVPDDLVRPDATLAELDMDSLALAEFALVLQERLGVRVGGEHASKSTTIAEVVAFLEERCAAEPVATR
ncbi:acyl carrier protein [Streptomyces sp. TRM64462]|uniref:acyl carrier protein n=1 Tax=Streptomyces sp. TRM64462 TaxID=2741726 RepID=UPI00158681A4|nr:acyl carrier protein [Streptomyces sp. TRM64462]